MLHNYKNVFTIHIYVVFGSPKFALVRPFAPLPLPACLQIFLLIRKVRPSSPLRPFPACPQIILIIKKFALMSPTKMSPKMSSPYIVRPFAPLPLPACLQIFLLIRKVRPSSPFCPFAPSLPVIKLLLLFKSSP